MLLAGGLTLALVTGFCLWTREETRSQPVARVQQAEAEVTPRVIPQPGVTPQPQVTPPPAPTPAAAQQPYRGRAPAQIAAWFKRMRPPPPPPPEPIDARTQNLNAMAARLEADRRLGPYVKGAREAGLTDSQQETLIVLLYARLSSPSQPAATDSAAGQDPAAVRLERSQTLSELLPALHSLLGPEAMSQLIPAAMRQPPMVADATRGSPLQMPGRPR
jgi:hypothetical protein